MKRRGLRGRTDLSVMHTHTRNGPPRPQNIKSHPKSRTQTHNFHHNISATTLRHIEDPLLQANWIFHKVQRLGSKRFGQFEPRWDAVDCEEVFRLVFECCDEGTETYGTATDEDCAGFFLLLGFEVLEGIFGGEVTPIRGGFSRDILRDMGKRGCTLETMLIISLHEIRNGSTPSTHDVRHQHNRLLRNLFWRMNKRSIRQRYPHVFGLSSIKLRTSKQQ